MNILAIIVLLLLLFFALNGYRRGFIKTFVSMVSLIASIVLVSIATPYVSDFLKTQTPVYSYLVERCEQALKLNSTDDKETEKETEAEAKTEVKKENSKEEVNIFSNIDQAKFIENLEIPEVLKNMLKDNNNEKSYEQLEVKDFTQYLPRYMASLILNIISFLLTLLLVVSFIWLTVMTLDVISNLPIIHGLNQKFGLLLGLAQGLLVVWIAFLIITVFSNTEIGSQLLAMITESKVTSFIYDQNILLKVLTEAMALLKL